jgi:CheY-like chemotaxis protein
LQHHSQARHRVCAYTMTGWKTLAVLFPGPRRFIIGALFAEPDRWWSLTELAGRSGISPKSARPHITRMLECGLIVQKQELGKVAFQADRSCPVFPDLSALVLRLTNAPGAGATVLVVEDQPATAQITRILLESWGYRVFEAHRPEDALQIFSQEPDIHLLLTDVYMPGMNGPELAHRMLASKPDLRIVLMSGDPGADGLPRGCAFLQKPFNPSGLARIVRRQLDRVNTA